MTTAGFPHSDTLGSPFGCQLPEAYRRLPRPSSAPDAKASTMRPYTLATTTHHHPPPAPPPTTDTGSTPKGTPVQAAEGAPRSAAARRGRAKRRTLTTKTQKKSTRRSTTTRNQSQSLSMQCSRPLCSSQTTTRHHLAHHGHQTPGDEPPTDVTRTRRPDQETNPTPRTPTRRPEDPRAGGEEQCPVPQDPTVRQVPTTETGTGVPDPTHPVAGEGAAVLATDQTMSTVLMFHPRAPACERSPQKPAHPTTTPEQHPEPGNPQGTRWADAP